MSKRLRRLGLAGAAVIGSTTIATGSALAADPGSGGAAVGTASATGVRTSYDFPGYLVVDTLYDAGGPVAQSVVNSSDGGKSFASFPYPGDTIVNSPALANVGTGQAFPFTYPLYVVTDGNLTPKASAQDATGSLVLKAESAARTATSTAKAAGPTAGVIATSGSVQETSVIIGDDGVMTSIADSIIRGIDVGGVLKLGEVHVRTVSLIKPGEKKPTTTSTTEVTGVSVMGQAVQLTKKGITAFGQGEGSPYKDGLAALNKSLTDAGIAVALADERRMDGGLSSAGVEILQRGKLPFEGSPVGVARTFIGNAASSILGRTDALVVAPPVTAPITGTDTDADPAPATDGTGTTEPPPVEDFGASIPVPDSSAVAPPVATETSPRTLPTVQFVPQAAPAAAVVPLDLEGELTLWYLAMAVGAALAAISAVLWRAKGGRSA